MERISLSRELMNLKMSGFLIEKAPSLDLKFAKKRRFITAIQNASTQNAIRKEVNEKLQ